MSTLHTTLAQDSFRLYFGVIDYVIEHLKKDLMKKGKDEEEATEIVNKLQSKWKENLHKSHCIDNKNMMGFNITDSPDPTTNIDHNAMHHNSNNKSTDDFQSGHAPPTSFTQLPSEITMPCMDDINDEGPQRKRQKFNNNHNNNDNIPPALHLPNMIMPNYPINNPHIQGLGVPQIDQVHNPFTHPEPQSNAYNLPQNDGANDVIQNKKQKTVKFIVQSDGPAPMKPTTVGFDDDDDDDEDEDVTQSENKNKKSDKEENDDIEQNNDTKTSNTSSVCQPHMVNGRDLNAPLCSDDDDTDDADDLDPPDKIICQFTKVVRKKNEWTVDLKHGLMHISGKDYAFHKASGGNFTWE